MADARRKIWNSWQRAYLVGLAFSPVYGAALAGVGLAIYRTVTGRFGFPAQPGHWVLLAIGGVMGIIASRPVLRTLPLSADGEEFILVCLMLVVATATAIGVGNNVWRLPMACAALGLTIICLSYAISLRSQSIEPPASFIFGFFVIAQVPFLGLLALACDLAGHKRHDIFHWFGVATFVGVLGHLLALVGAGRI
ncbi:MAG TPA: hypothetical protein VFV87_04865 [Pirellulaceae bacterium]|nr:hypothetical protein [Pirellulaceae bacterium]